MKNLTIILVIITEVLNISFGQDTFAPVGAKWIYTEPKIFGLFEGPKYFEITGMDTIEGKVCSRITYDTSFMGDVTHFYQDSNKLYFRVKNSEVDTFLLFFDQSAKENDTLDIGVRNAPYYEYNNNDSIPFFSMKIIIDSVGQEEINNISLKVWYISALSNSPMTCHEIGWKYYENVGYNYIFLPYFGCLDPPVELTLRCYEDPNTFFKFVDFACDYHSATSDSGISDKLLVFPNPVSDQISLSLPPGMEAINIVIYNLMGKKLLTTEYKDAAIDVSILNQGYYIIKVSDEEGKVVLSKFVKS